MRSTLSSFLVHGSLTAIVAVAMGSVHAGEIAATSADGMGLVGDLAVMNDLEPLAETAAISATRDRFVSARPVSHVKADPQLRASVPSTDRSRSLVSGGDVFANSKAVLPLLVGDMEPVISPVARPMSGRLVGARPSLPLLNRVLLTRPISDRPSAE